MFRIYDDDDNGLISADNLTRCANDLMETVTEEEVNMMIEMADRNKKGGVDLEDFIELMKEMNLIPDKDRKKDDDDDAVKGEEEFNPDAPPANLARN